MHDLIDQTVFLEKFGSLKSFWQILVRRFPDHAWPSKTNHTFGFGDDDVTKRSITRHYAGGGRIGEHRNVRQARVGVPGERAAGLSHLHQTERSEERRVGKECRSRWWRDHKKKKKKDRSNEMRY